MLGLVGGEGGGGYGITRGVLCEALAVALET